VEKLNQSLAKTMEAPLLDDVDIVVLSLFFFVKVKNKKYATQNHFNKHLTILALLKLLKIRGICLDFLVRSNRGNMY